LHFEWMACRRQFALALLVLALLPLGRGQSVTQGSLSGTVTDTLGGVIVGAQVAVSSADGSIVRGAATGPDGEFTIAGLPNNVATIVLTVPPAGQSSPTAFVVGSCAH